MFHDLDADGKLGAGEPGISGVKVTLAGTDDTGKAITAVSVLTGTDGTYKFTGLRAGTYTVTETQPTTYLDGKDAAGNYAGTVGNDVVSSVSLPFAATATGYNFGEVKAASVAGVVYYDANNDGVKSGTTEVGIAGATVTLTGTDDLGAAVTKSLTTTSSGAYSFTGLRPGTYAVTETQPTAYLDGKDALGKVNGTASGTAGNDVFTTVVLGSGAAGTDYNFGEIKPSSIAGVVYFDANNDGVKSGTAEVGIAGATVTLVGTNDLGPVSLTATTNSIGEYAFGNLRPGTYTVTETQPAAYADGKDSVGTLGGTPANDQFSAIAVGQGVAGTGYNFGELRGLTISGHVYEDKNDDGTLQAGEIGVAGVTVNLSGKDDLGNLVNLTATTDAKGAYSFTGLRPGTYTIAETQPATYIDGKEHVGTAGGDKTTNDVFGNVVLTPTTVATDYDFGEIKPVSFAGTVYHDLNANGTLDAGEPGIGGVTITLTGTDSRGAAVTKTATTLPDGTYSFTGLLPGTYTVAETQPGDYLDGQETTGNYGYGGGVTNDKFNSIVLPYAAAATGYNFGEVKASSLAGNVFEDLNNNGTFDAGEPAIAGVTVTLTGRDDQFRNITAVSVTTAADGSYSFTGLRPGTYIVAETQPATYLDGKEHVGTSGGDKSTNDKIVAIKLGSNVAATQYDFGELKAASIAGFVYCDGDYSGTQNSTDEAIATTVTLFGTRRPGQAGPDRDHVGRGHRGVLVHGAAAGHLPNRRVAAGRPRRRHHGRRLAQGHRGIGHRDQRHRRHVRGGRHRLQLRRGGCGGQRLAPGHRVRRRQRRRQVRRGRRGPGRHHRDALRQGRHPGRRHDDRRRWLLQVHGPDAGRLQVGRVAADRVHRGRDANPVAVQPGRRRRPDRHRRDGRRPERDAADLQRRERGRERHGQQPRHEREHRRRPDAGGVDGRQRGQPGRDVQLVLHRPEPRRPHRRQLQTSARNCRRCRRRSPPTSAGSATCSTTTPTRRSTLSTRPACRSRSGNCSTTRRRT